MTFTPHRVVATYSIVARDPETGELGVAVQSHWFSVGTVVSWAEAGVGAVATQSLADPAYGPLGLDLMRAGRSAQLSLDALLAGDEEREGRQVAFIHSTGAVAVHTGSGCIAEAGHIAGDQFSVQANMMANNTVWDAMANAYRTADGDLAERMLVALEAAEAVGGDIRGRQSAAMLIVSGEKQDEPWQGVLLELRIEDHPDPLAELRRLIRVHRAYEHMNTGDLAIEHEDEELALKEYGAAMELFPDNLEMQYWTAVSLANMGRLDEAVDMFKGIFARDENWRTLLPRLADSGLMKAKDVKKILKKTK